MSIRRVESVDVGDHAVKQSDARIEWETHPTYAGVERIVIGQSEKPRAACVYSRFSPGSGAPVHGAKEPAIEYNIVLDGELELTLEGGEVVPLSAGDVHVQGLGVGHGWAAPAHAAGTLLTVVIWTGSAVAS
jgi:quercetin dioxygenase-like cupin family protein